MIFKQSTMGLIGSFLLVFACNADTIITNHEQKELQLTQSWVCQKPLLEQIDKTYTTHGRTLLAHILDHPHTSIEIIQHKQELIRSLVQNPDLCKQLRILCKEFANFESVSHFFSPQESSLNRILSPLYFSSSFLKGLNTNSFALQISDTASRALSCAPLILEAATLYLINHLAHNSSNGHGHAHQTHEPNCGCDAPKYAQRAQNPVLKLFLKSHTTIHIALGVAGAVDVYKILKQKDHTLKEAKSLIISLDKCIKIHQQMQAYLSNHPLLHYVAIPSLEGEDFKSLKAALNRVTTGHSWFTEKGNLLVAYGLAHKHKELIQDICTSIAEIDFYTSLATLMLEGTDAHPYCFVELNHKPEPYIHMVNAWNTIVPDSQAQTITFDLNQRAILITGPNASGKSTFLRTIAHAIVLAQSCGIAPAQEMKLNLINRLVTFLSNHDDLTTGKSLFTHELERAQQLVDSLKTNNKSVLILADEMFRGTDYIQGQQIARRFLKSIAVYPQTIMGIATHFYELTALESEGTGIINYCMNFLADDEQERYTCIRGIASAEDVLTNIRQRSRFTLLDDTADKL